jgi:hypothetical protein
VPVYVVMDDSGMGVGDVMGWDGNVGGLLQRKRGVEWLTMLE